jgi:hypothetical protein
MVQMVPFQDSARGVAWLTWARTLYPTAVQAVAALQDTLSSTLLTAFAALGTVSIFQLVPFHVSAIASMPKVRPT